ncbi:unnamed protein product [Phaedon cochleariae]|uniref:HTH psq-type domain-containing protein n=1 Tax=Phaedon cochleariae TaxID=80249 RepID=A0A9P0GSY3_PHACE|nr:unnamed protein product [Phaedon cochleariae]
MPKVKKGYVYKKKYSEPEITRALEAIKKGMSKKQAAKTYRIPRATLQFRMSERFKKIRHGPETVLSTSEEELLVKWINDNQRKGFPRRKEDIQQSVKEFLNKIFEDNLGSISDDHTQNNDIIIEETMITPNNDTDKNSNDYEELASSEHNQIQRDQGHEEEIDKENIDVPEEQCSLEKSLRWPETPTRKGNKTTERMPFVLVSTGWKKIYTEKQEKKAKEELDKESRRLERLKKKILTEHSKSKKKAPRTKNNKNTNTGPRKDDSILHASKNTQMYFEPAETQQPIIISDIKLKPSQKTAVRNIFHEKQENTIFDDNIVETGLCFLCTMNITRGKNGVRCLKCYGRQYHKLCLEKRNVNVKNFICSVCSGKT